MTPLASRLLQNLPYTTSQGQTALKLERPADCRPLATIAAAIPTLAVGSSHAGRVEIYALQRRHFSSQTNGVAQILDRI